VSRTYRKKRLGDILTLEYGKPLPREDRAPEGKYPVFGANGVKSYTNVPYHKESSIIVGRKGTAGAVTLTDGGFWPLDVTYFVTFDKSEYVLKYLYYLLCSLNLPRLATGVKPGINRNNVYSIDCLVPYLEEQKRVVAILDETFAGIETAIANTEKNLANARELFSSYLSQTISRGLALSKQSDLEEFVKFIDYRGKTPKKVDSGLRLITAKNVRMGYLQRAPEEFVEPESYDSWMTRGIPREGDVLFTTEAPLGYACQLDTRSKVVFAQRIITLQPDRSVIDPAYLKYCLMSSPMQVRIHEKATGATASGIKASLLRKIQIPVPELTVQKEVVINLEGLEQKCKSLEEIIRQKLASLAELKQSLLQKAFSGELTADGAEGDIAETSA